MDNWIDGLMDQDGLMGLHIDRLVDNTLDFETLFFFLPCSIN